MDCVLNTISRANQQLQPLHDEPRGETVIDTRDAGMQKDRIIIAVMAPLASLRANTISVTSDTSHSPTNPRQS